MGLIFACQRLGSFEGRVLLRMTKRKLKWAAELPTSVGNNSVWRSIVCQGSLNNRWVVFCFRNSFEIHFKKVLACCGTGMCRYWECVGYPGAGFVCGVSFLMCWELNSDPLEEQVCSHNH